MLLSAVSQGGWCWKVIADVTAVTDHAKAAYPDLPIFLFGHSMGGLIALNTAVSHPRTYSGIAIWNTNFAVGAMGRLAQVVLKTERALKGSDVPSLILPKLTFETWGKSMPDSKTQADWLSRDRSEVEAYEADPLCGFDISISMWLDVFELTFRGTEASLLSDCRSHALPLGRRRTGSRDGKGKSHRLALPPSREGRLHECPQTHLSTDAS